MRAEEVLSLVRAAPERYETVRAALVYRGNGPKIKAVRERFARSEAGRRIFGEPPEKIEHPEPNCPFGWRYRVWRIDDHLWRQELELPGGGVNVTASTGRRRLPIGGAPGSNKVWHRRTNGGSRRDDPPWLYLADHNFWTMYPLDPTGFASIDFELGLLDLSVEEGEPWAGRDAIRLRGVPVEEWDGPPEPLWWGADEYEAVVDAERGVLLRLASRLGGEDIDALEVEEIHFDEPFQQEEVFASRDPLPWH